jgi:3-oxoacyl-[acyl-carrier-protein] synthase I
MTAANSEAVQRCITNAILNSGIGPGDVDVINGHLTATTRDSVEIENWVKALKRGGGDFPFINSLKGMTGHCLAASGSIECVASVLQLRNNFIFGNVNCEDLHPEIEKIIDPAKVPLKTLKAEGKIDILAKASFGFGDVNAVVVFKRI